MDFDRFTHLTFDCYGTLIDWETGILAALVPVLAAHGREAIPEAEILRFYVRHEAEQEAGPYRSYREVLRNTVAGIAAELGFAVTEAEKDALPESVAVWPPFADTVAALQRLKTRYKLVIVSNIDDDLFAGSARLLGVPFDAVITAQQVGSYKPAHEHFLTALERLGAPREQVLHVAQSLYHDHVPAKALGFSTVRVNRPSRLPVTGLSPAVDAAPDLEVPDLKSLADAMGL